MINEKSTNSFKSDSKSFESSEASSNRIINDSCNKENNTGFCGTCCCFGSSIDQNNTINSSSSSINDGSVHQKRRINPVVKLIKALRNSKYTSLTYYKNNLSFYLTILAYILIQIILVVVQLHIYSDVNLPLKFARAGGILLSFNSGLIIVLVLRRLVTWVRNSFIGRNYLPVDDFIRFHKFLGILIIMFTIQHTLGHCVNLCKHF